MTILLLVLLAAGLILCARSAFILSDPRGGWQIGLECGLVGLTFAGVGSLGLVIHALGAVLR